VLSCGGLEVYFELRRHVAENLRFSDDEDRDLDCNEELGYKLHSILTS
jgi:hypothetical protein